MKIYLFHGIPQRVKIKTQTLNIYFTNLQIREYVKSIIKICLQKSLHFKSSN